MKKTVLRKYAQLVAKMGLNVQKGQDVWINAGVDQAEFVTMIVEECYKLKARDVRVEWSYQPLTKAQYRYKALKDLGKYEKWQLEKLQYQADVVPCRLFIYSEDPDGLKGVNIEKMAKVRQMLYPTAKKYRDMWDGKDQWCIVAASSEKWAKKLFPQLSKKQAVEKLWEAIISCARVTDDPIKSWEDHNADLKKRCEYLNSLKIRSLHYDSSNGTDFTVGLIDTGVFCAGQEVSLNKIAFNPNMPSEECFTSPKKGEAEGIVYATKPYCYGSQLIENFWIRFKEGKAVEWHAEKNNDLLTKMITMDEGSAYLGECALVPFDSPINNSGILFYNTLYDENAVCHIAMGRGFENCLEGYENMTMQECAEKGINQSMNHEDLMIGSSDMNITATTADGRQVPIFRNGNWAF